MFGFLRPAAGDVPYRQIYAGLCAAQHRQAGLRTLPMLSYEAVFLYQLAVDAGVCAAPAAGAARCCRLRKSGPRVYVADQRIARFCSAFGLLLAATKLEDDVRDDRSWLARFALWWLRSPIRAARSFLSEFEPEFPARMHGCIDRHLQFESGEVIVDWQAYAEPTAEAFAAVFALFARLLAEADDGSNSTKLPARLSRIGGEIGRAIIYFDCAVDWQQDRRRGRYNPLAKRGDVRRAFEAAQQSLANAGWLCCEAWGERCGTAKVLRAAFDRLSRRSASPNMVEGRAAERARRWP
ncbi:MAG: hypothetical protein KDA62_14410, partial [Planctomycetales bacterium]|nr:hypothetical protein [Planctomycetales bacterium]